VLHDRELLVGEDPVDHAAHIALVVDRVVLGATEQLRVLAQQPGANRMECGCGDAARPLMPEQVGEPQAQLAGRADAERHCEDL
jgi:hypothetical protein